MKDLAGAYLRQGSGIGQGMLCCPAARKVVHVLAFGNKQLSISLMTNAQNQALSSILSLFGCCSVYCPVFKNENLVRKKVVTHP